MPREGSTLPGATPRWPRLAALSRASMAETSSLRDILQQLVSDVATQHTGALEGLRDWLADARHTAVAQTNPDYYTQIVRIVVEFMRRQVQGLSRARKNVTFKSDAAVHLQVAVRAACGGGRGALPLLSKVVRKLWEHVDEMLRSDIVLQRQPNLLPYYCRIVRELAERADLGYLSELRGESYRRLLRQLLQLGTAASLEAAASLCRHAEAELPPLEVASLCDRALQLLRAGGAAAASFLAAACLRCTFAFRDWVLADGRVDGLAEAMMAAEWAAKASSGFEIVLRLGIGFGAPMQPQHAAGLMSKAERALEALARGETNVTSSPRVARLAELMAALLLRSEATVAEACARLTSLVEQRCLPWSLCVVRLCEGHAATLFGERHGSTEADLLLSVFDALSSQFDRGDRLTGQEAAAVHAALVAILASRAGARLWPAGVQIPAVPLPLSSLCGESAAASMAVPDFVGALPADIMEMAPEWRKRLPSFARHALTAVSLGPLAPRGIHYLLATVLLVSPPDDVDSTARQFLTQMVANQVGGAARNGRRLSAPLQCCILAAMRWHQPDATSQRSLYSALETADASIEMRAAFLRLCASDGRWTLPSPRAAQPSVVSYFDDDDTSCAHALMDDECSNHQSLHDFRGVGSRSIAANSDNALANKWYRFRLCKLLRRVETAAASAALDRAADYSDTFDEDLRVHHVIESAALGVRSVPWRLGHRDVVHTLAKPPDAAAFAAPESPTTSPAYSAALENFLTRARDFIEVGSIVKLEGADPVEEPASSLSSLEAVLALAENLLRVMGAIMPLPGGVESKWQVTFKECLLRILCLAREHFPGRSAAAARLGEGLFAFLAVTRRATSLGATVRPWASPEVVGRYASLAQALSEAWTPPSASAERTAAIGHGPPQGGEAAAGFARPPHVSGGAPTRTERQHASDHFEARGPSTSAAGGAQDSAQRSLTLRLLVALAFADGVPAADATGGGGGGSAVACLQRVLLHAGQAGNAALGPALRIASQELSADGPAAIRDRCGAECLDALVEAWCSVKDPQVASGEMHAHLLCALRFVSVVGESVAAAKSVCRCFRDATTLGDGQLITLLRKWNHEPDCLDSQSKLVLGVLCARSVPMLTNQNVGDSIISAVCDALMCRVTDVIMKDDSVGTRLAVSTECVQRLFKVFNPGEVILTVGDAWAPLLCPEGLAVVGPPASAELVAVRVMMEVCCVEDLAWSVLPELCAVRPGLWPVVRLALGALDETLLGCRGSGGTSRLALILRAQIFVRQLKAGRRLVDLRLADLSLHLPPLPGRQPLARHVAASVAAMAIAEDLGQLPDLAQACGHASATAAEFDSLIFVPLAGAILPLRRSLEQLRTRYGQARAAAYCKRDAHRIFAFAMQLPFLTAGALNALDAQSIATTFAELDRQSPWADFGAFVSTHFHFLLYHLDRILSAWGRWFPSVTVDLLRAFAGWAQSKQTLHGARLRLLLPALWRHGLALPMSHRKEVCNTIDFVVASSADALGRIALHQDESLREMLAAVESHWALRADGGDDAPRGEGKSSPPLVALLAVLRSLRRDDPKLASGEVALAARQDGHGATWFRLQVEAMLPRLHPAARLLIDEIDVGPAAVSGQPPPAKRRRAIGGGLGAALRPLAPPDARLAWGPPAAPDLGAIVQCLMDAGCDELNAASGSECDGGASCSRLIRLLSQPSVAAQMKRDRSLSRMMAKGLSQISPNTMALLCDAEEADLLETSLPALVRAERERQSQSPTGQAAPSADKLVDDIFCARALLGASALQVHPSARVRHSALAALGQLSRQRHAFDGARTLLTKILDQRHLCLADLVEVMPADAAAQAPAPIGDCTGTWAFFNDPTTSALDFSTWVRLLSSKMLSLGSAAWDKPAAEMLQACAPLASCVDWFAEQMLVLVILKAAMHRVSGRHLAEVISTFFRGEAVEAAQAQCVIRGLHYVRLYQTGQRNRAVPHFPADGGDHFWGSLDLFAVAACATRVGCARDGLLYLELHLARQFQDEAIDQTILKSGSQDVGVDDLFRAPKREVELLHMLARQLPNDELIYGVSQWCHASSRLVRAELGHDHLLQLQIHSDMLEAELHSSSATPPSTTQCGPTAQVGLEGSLAHLGFHTLFALGDAPRAGASAAVWERRMEGLWRMRQWGDDGQTSSAIAATASASAGFHAELRGVLAGLAGPSDRAARKLAVNSTTQAATTPLEALAAEVSAGLHARSLEQWKTGAVQLQMLGSVFSVVDAAVSDSGTPASGAAVCTLAGRWTPSSSAPMSPAHFVLVEPLLALRSTLLSIAAPPLIELRYLTALAAQTRDAMQVHRALGLLEQAHRISLGAPRTDVLRLRWEQARCFWELRQQQECLSIARAVAAECRQTSPQLTGAGAVKERSWMARALSDTGLWLSISRLESPAAVRRDFLEPAVTMSPSDTKPRRQLAEFLDAQLGEEIARQNSFEYGVLKRLRQRTQADLEKRQKELQALERNPRGRDQELKQLRESVRVQHKACEQDKQQEAKERQMLKTLVVHCIQEFGQCLVESGLGANAEGDEGLSKTRVACRFLSLWFDNCRDNAEVTKAVNAAMNKLAFSALSPFLYQLAARLGTQDGDFGNTLEELVYRIANGRPHNLWPLLLLKNGDQVPKGMRNADLFVADKDKIEAAKRVIERLRQQKHMKGVVDATEVVSKFYMGLAFHEVDKKNRDVKIRTVTLEHFKEARRVCQHIPVPTANPPPEGGPPAPGIHFFVEQFGVAKQGLSAPKMFSVHDTAGKEHHQIVKGHDDLRQDAVMQQLFRLLNDIFGEKTHSPQADLRFRTFQVVPLSPCAGIMECVTDAITLGELLTGNNNTGPGGAHGRYRPNDMLHFQCRKRMADAREEYNSGNSDALDRGFREVCLKFRPVMNLVFLERFPSPAEWHQSRQHYARSVAVTSMVGYILGIGDRHPNNILFDCRTGELVHIDFGITFDAGKNLRVPELVPCRLSRDIVAGLGCLGTCGLFRRSCETALGVLREGSALVNAVAEVFVHDPVFLWSLNRLPRRQAQDDVVSDPSQALASGAGAALTDEGGNEMARRALLAVSGKLHGKHGAEAAALGVPAHVNWILREAMDMGNLARLYQGWSQWL